MTFFENSIYFLIIFQNIFSQNIFCSDGESNQALELLEITPSSLIGGYRLSELTRTVDSYDTQLSYAKYLVSLRKDEDETNFGYNHVCGGVILGEKLVLTAAHCVVKNDEKVSVSSLAIVAKSPLRLSSNLNTQILKVRSVIIHPKFSLARMHYDIALLKLRQSIELDNKWAASIALPKQRINNSTLCTVLGWGKLYLHGPLANQLLFLNVTLLDKQICKQMIYNFGDAKLCTIDSYDNNPCTGDSGGPLICDDVLAGIVSYANQYCIGMPAVYTDVYDYKRWINTNGAEILHFGLENMPLKIVIGFIIIKLI